MKIPNEAIDITIKVLEIIPELHYKACFEDISGRPDFDCVCPIKNIIEKLLKIRYSKKKNKKGL